MKKMFVMAVAILFSAATMAQTKTKQPKNYKMKKDSSYMMKDSMSVMQGDTSSMKKNSRYMKKKTTTRPMKDSMPK